MIRIVPALFYAFICVTLANAAGLAFNATSNIYELKSAALDDTENISLEVWLQVDASCPEGARILDKWGPGSQEGYVLELGPAGSLQFITTAPTPCRYEGKLSADKATHVVAVFVP